MIIIITCNDVLIIRRWWCAASTCTFHYISKDSTAVVMFLSDASSTKWITIRDSLVCDSGGTTWNTRDSLVSKNLVFFVALPNVWNVQKNPFLAVSCSWKIHDCTISGVSCLSIFVGDTTERNEFFAMVVWEMWFWLRWKIMARGAGRVKRLFVCLSTIWLPPPAIE